MSGNRSGGLVGLVTQGVGVAAEYREHRKQKKQQRLSRENSRQDEQASHSGPSTLPQSQSPRGSDRSLDAYTAPAELPGNSGHRVLASGGPARDDKKGALFQYHEDDEKSDDSLSVEDDEEDWELDEMLPSYEESETKYRTADKLARDVMLTSRAAPDVPRVRHALPLPVIIPQRRPRKKARGFVRAYAPVLADSGIDQATFLSFLDNFYKSSQASPVFTVIAVSAAIAGLAPSVIAMAVTTAVQVAARVGAEAQGRQRTNNFLDKMNDDLFKPAGLYAFIMKYKGDDDANPFSNAFGFRGEKIDMSTNQIIAKYAGTLSEQGTGGRGMGERMRDLRVASGTTRGSMRMPEAAPLIFPDIDNAVARDGAEETFKDKAKDAKFFLADYLDRRAQAQYARDDPRSNLALPEEQRSFRSRLADPNHPMYQGRAGLMSLATGGRGAPELGNRGADRRYRRDERRVLKYEQRMDDGRQLSRRKQGRCEHFLAEQDRLYGNGRAVGLGALGQLRSGRRQGGPGGLIGGLIGAAVNAATDRGGGGSSATYGQSVSSNARESRGRGFEDAYDDRYEREDYYDDPSRRVSNNGGGAAAAAYQKFSRRGQRGGGERQGAIGAVKRLMSQDVLYLMVVNMPSEAEMAEAREEMERMKGW
ncbi:hypothetical protein B0A55_04006 [Friedmanniomyces simplex]|uniref:Uncharacterized protein n=1 Tax=Friedmanniomyces simplex TaxID=329884 RepID=A0A4U0XMZ2_9PEZI|nr:hypothetical protein B0A55_04006 [Friedmanniomyces simplex]